ncbi:MAG: hypothetical protein JNK64_17420 [Myxococcales bacterium]|nr:hypothetical protein [Myxococcales bacterium]
MVVVGVLLGTAAPAAADLVAWVDDVAEPAIDAPVAGGHLAVTQRAMPYGSGYQYVQLTAAFDPAHGPRRTTLLFEGPTMCASTIRVGRGVEVAVCTNRFGDTREVTRWRLDRTTGRLVAGAPRWRSPYAEGAQAVLRALYAGRERTAEAALEQLGDSPDGQVSVGWWWAAHRLLAAWSTIARLPPAAARAALTPHVARLLAPDDDGSPNLVAALAADLRAVPRCSYTDLAGRARPFRVVGVRARLAPVVARVERLLAAGDATQRAQAVALRQARVRPPP